MTETCDPQNALQLTPALAAGASVTKVQVAPNHTADSHLLAEALPNLKQRMDLDQLYTDAGHGGKEADVVLQKQQVTHIQTAIRCNSPNDKKLSLSDFIIKLNEKGKPVQITCPQQQQAPVHPSSQKKDFVAFFDSAICYHCPYWQAGQCPTHPRKRDARHHLEIRLVRAYSAQRRRQSQAQKKEVHNLRAAIEATIRSVKHPFPAGKLPVRGSFRMACLLIGSAAVTNVCRIQHYLKAESQSAQQEESFFVIGKAFLMSWISLFQSPKLYLGC